MTTIVDSPAILKGEIRLFNKALYVAIDVCTAFTALTMLVSLAALGVQLVRKEQRKIVKRMKANGGVYLLPHSPVLAPIMVTSYCIVGVATGFVLRAWLWKGSQAQVVQRLTLLLPMPLLMWAWLSAFSNAFAWHLTPLGSCRHLKHLRFQPRTLNIVCWTVPLVVFSAQLAIVNIWPTKQLIANELSLKYAALHASLAATDPLLLQAKADVQRATRLAEMFYQASWGVWAAAYGACWLIYAVYSSLLLTLMGKQLLYVDTITSDWTTQAMTQAGQDSGSDATTRRSLTERTSEVLKRTSGVTKDLFRRASHGSDMRVLSKRDLLKRNARLIWLEFFSFSFFTLCWCLLATTKSILGYRVLNNPRTGPITVLGELYESTIFGLIVVTLMLFRGINILRNRKTEDDTLASHSTDSKVEEAGVPVAFEDMLSPEPASLAARRAKRGMSISLNIGNYVVPSRVATPTGQGPITLHSNLLHEDPSKSTFFGGDTPQSEYFNDKIEAFPGSRRRSSVTFADELPLSPLSHVIQIPTLSFIEASPLMQQTEQLEVSSKPV